MDIVELTKNTAQNMYELMLALAQRIDTLEKENAELKRKLELHQDDLK